MAYKSHGLAIYEKYKGLATDDLGDLTPEQIAFCDEVYLFAEDHYSSGGDTIVECYTPKEIVKDFQTLDDAKRFCKHRKEREDEIKATEW